MNNLPSAVLDILSKRVLKETSAAWLLIDSDGYLKELGGRLTTYGLENIEKGCLVKTQAIFLEGILSMQGLPISIDSIQIDNGEYADVYLVEEQADRWIILLGRTDSSRWKGLAQQKANELKLLQNKIIADSRKTNKIDFSSLMGILALEQNKDGSFRILEPIPGCSSEIYPETSEQYDDLHPENDFPFIANFMEDCRVVWNSGQEERLKSGPWVEMSQSGEEYVLEATAILWQQRKILLIEHLNGDYQEHLAVLQLGRENSLTKYALEREMHKQQLMEKTLLEARIEADRANLAKSEFLSSMSHELRTPLNSILGFAQLLMSDPNNPLNKEQQENLNYIMTSGHHLLDLINEVLDLAKIESGEMDISIENIFSNDVMDACLPAVKVLADKQDIVISHAVVQTGVQIKADFKRISQVVLNLLSNAVKYNRKGGTIDIEEAITEKGNFKLTIKDSGIGIPENQQNKLFTAFARLGQEDSEIVGTGVGLIVTKKIVEKMNGQIGFESTEGKGSTFWVEFPLATDSNLE